jgi:hypothetical protein
VGPMTSGQDIRGIPVIETPDSDDEGSRKPQRKPAPGTRAVPTAGHTHAHVHVRTCQGHTPPRGHRRSVHVAPPAAVSAPRPSAALRPARLSSPALPSPPPPFPHLLAALTSCPFSSLPAAPPPQERANASPMRGLRGGKLPTMADGR